MMFEQPLLEPNDLPVANEPQVGPIAAIEEEKKDKIVEPVIPSEPIACQEAELAEPDFEELLMPAQLAEEPFREAYERAGNLPRRGIEDVKLHPRIGVAFDYPEPVMVEPVNDLDEVAEEGPVYVQRHQWRRLEALVKEENLKRGTQKDYETQASRQCFQAAGSMKRIKLPENAI